MFPCLRLPLDDALLGIAVLSPQDPEAWLAQEEARYAAGLEAVRNRSPPGQPIGFDAKAQAEDAAAKGEEEDDEEMEDEEDITDDDAPADRF
uniref:Uncharacterized protein n=1 Tax=Zooxanthella nutricula TaxID=1333877 RepID=A0A7S2P6D4_9DINO